MAKITGTQIRRTLTASGVSVSALAKLLRTNRVTVSCWVNDRKVPGGAISPRLKVVLEALANAVSIGTLPLKEPLVGAEKDLVLRRIVVTELTARGFHVLDI